MTGANQQIVTAFEDLGLTPEEIAHEQELDLTCVKATLMQFSSTYRRSCKVVEEHNFTDEEHVMARQVIANIARYSDDESLQLRAAVYIRDDKTGRLDAVKQMAGLNINVLEFNTDMKKALASIERSKNTVIEAKPAEVLVIEDSVK